MTLGLGDDVSADLEKQGAANDDNDDEGSEELENAQIIDGGRDDGSQRLQHLGTDEMSFSNTPSLQGTIAESSPSQLQTQDSTTERTSAQP